MALTDVKIKAISLPAGKKQLRASDSGGLYLQITPSGKYWRMAYRFGGKQKTLSVGIYPTVSLKLARKYREQAKRLLQNGTDPSQAKQQEKRKAVADAQAITFEAVAREWLAKKSTTWVATTVANCTARLERHAFPWIGSLPIAGIEAPDVLSLIYRVEQRGSIETAHRLRMLCSQIFRYAVATSRIKSDPTRDLKGALTPLNS
ncbi:MAG: integrase arm-type DNA-binding domain-containing protein, partial [Mariprofundales bacterium]